MAVGWVLGGLVCLGLLFTGNVLAIIGGIVFLLLCIRLAYSCSMWFRARLEFLIYYTKDTLRQEIYLSELLKKNIEKPSTESKK